MKKRISIAMTTCNGERFIEKQIQSLIRQSLQPYELVIFDDASTDNTLNILKAHIPDARFPVHLHVNQSRIGWRENFMKSAVHCSGDLIAFCDQDDIWRPDKLQRVGTEFSDDHVSMVFHAYNLIDETDAKLETQLRTDTEKRVYDPNRIDSWALMLGFSMTFRRDLIDLQDYWKDSLDRHVDANGSDLVAAHDQWILFLSSVLGRCVYIPDKIVDYRLHSRNTMGIRASPHGIRDIAASFRESQKKLSHRIRVLERYLHIITQIGDESCRYSNAFRTAEPIYRDHLHLLQSRLKIYRTDTFRERVSSFAQLLASGAYESRYLPLAKWEIRKDFAATIFGRSFRNNAR